MLANIHSYLITIASKQFGEKSIKKYLHWCERTNDRYCALDNILRYNNTFLSQGDLFLVASAKECWAIKLRSICYGVLGKKYKKEKNILRLLI